MPAILAGIVAFFRFFKWSNLVSWVFSSVTFGSMLGINLIILGLSFAYFASILKILEFIYSKSNYIIEYINNFNNLADDIFSYGMIVLKSLGIWNAFVDVYNIFSVTFAALIVIYASKLFLIGAKAVRENLIALCISKIN